MGRVSRIAVSMLGGVGVMIGVLCRAGTMFGVACGTGMMVRVVRGASRVMMMGVAGGVVVVMGTASHVVVVMVEVMMGVWLCHHRTGKGERKQRKQRSVFHDRHSPDTTYGAITMPHSISRAAKIKFFPQMNRRVMQTGHTVAKCSYSRRSGSLGGASQFCICS